MISIFDQPHIFIVFNPGSGGNFIAGIVNQLLNSIRTNLDICPNGSSHTVLSDKSAGTDFLSFGTTMEEHDCFLSEEARESYFLDNIKEKYANSSNPEVVWSHDFTNIPLYRKYFKNAKILVITNDTVQEKIISLFMLYKKTILNKDVQLPMTEGLWEYVIARWKISCKQQLVPIVGEELANKMVRNRFDDEYKDMLYYASSRMVLNFFNMLHLVEAVPEKEILYDKVIYPLRFKFGRELNSYIDDECVVLPYRYLLDNDLELLIRKISEVLEEDLNEQDIQYIGEMFQKYRDAQDHLMLSDPVKYYEELRRAALNKCRI